MNERVPEDNELFPTEVDARVAAAHFNARNGYGRRAAAVSPRARVGCRDLSIYAGGILVSGRKRVSAFKHIARAII